MIRSLEIKNFFSFRDEASLDLTVNAKAGERNIFALDPADSPDSSTRVNKVMAIFGANASGKTQFLKAFSFLHWFILHSAQQGPKRKLLPMAFLFDPDSETQPTEFALEFSVGEQLFRYELSIKQRFVQREVLKVKKARWNTLFNREKDEAAEGYRFSPGSSAFWRGQPARQNASIISWAILADEPGVAKEIGQWFSTIQTNVSHGGRTPHYDPQFGAMLEAAEHFEDHPDHLQWVNDRLCDFDLGLTGVEISKAEMVLKNENDEQQKKEVPWPAGLHRMTNGENRSLPLLKESLGTQSLFILLRYLLPVLKSGGVAILDEFEHGLHAHMLPILVDLFLSQNNPNNAQLIFTCHSDFLIRALEKYQLALVAKDRDGVSDIWRADETGVRPQDNLYAKYHAGKLGGVPDL